MSEVMNYIFNSNTEKGCCKCAVLYELSILRYKINFILQDFCHVKFN